jgi:preprotein translocase subunit SecD
MKKRFFLILPVLLAVLACASVSNFLVPQATLILAPDQTASWDKAAFQEARDIIEERLNNASLSGRTEVSVSGDTILVKVYRSIDLEMIKTLSTKVGMITFIDSATGYAEREPVPDAENIIMTQADIKTVNVIQDTMGNYELAVEFTDEGARTLAEYSKDNIGRYLVIARDGVTISSPMIQSEITEGSAVITGNFDEASANALAVELQTEPLPFELFVLDVQRSQ